jgi:hypothetical protein
MGTILTFVLPWVIIVVFACIASLLCRQLIRPDDDWKGWDDPSVPYKRPRWGLQPKPLLKLIALVVATFLLIDWMKNDTTSLVSTWVRGDDVDYWKKIVSSDWTAILIGGTAAVGLSWLNNAVWLDGQKVGEQRERRRWQALNAAEQWTQYCEEQGDKAGAQKWRDEAARLRLEVEQEPKQR